MSHDNYHDVYQDVAQREIDAYHAFRTIYEARTPPPEPPTIDGDDRVVKAGLLVIMLASLIVSASHTIPVFVSTLPEAVQNSVIVWFVALMIFVMIESGIVFYSYTRTKNHASLTGDGHRPQHVKNLMNGGMWLAFVIAVGANVYSAVEVKIDVTPGWWLWFDFLIALLTGASAPILALISGDILGMLTVVDRHRAKRARQEYAVELEDWQESLNNSWNANKKKWGIRTDKESFAPIQQHSLNSVNEQRMNENSNGHSVNGSVNGSANGYSKNMNSREIITAYFEQYPDQVNDDSLTTDDAKARIDEWAERSVGRTSVYNVRKELQGST